MTAVHALRGALGQAVYRSCTTQGLITLRTSAGMSPWLHPHMPARPPDWATDLTSRLPSQLRAVFVGAGAQMRIWTCVLVTLA